MSPWCSRSSSACWESWSARASNGARITGAVFAIIFALMGLGGIVMAMLTTAAADLAADNVGLGQIMPNWYFAGGIVLGLVQTVISILAIVKLFGKQAAGYCRLPKA